MGIADVDFNGPNQYLMLPNVREPVRKGYRRGWTEFLASTKKLNRAAYRNGPVVVLSKQAKAAINRIGLTRKQIAAMTMEELESLR